MENYIPWTRGKLIGKGSCGTVCMAKNKSNGSTFAVKSVELGSNNTSQLQILENEIMILSSVSSPYIVKYFGSDFSWESSSSYRNMHIEYIPGGTAAGICCTEEKLGMIRSITRCIVKALEYLHSKGIVHCDVKGKNILLGNLPGTAKLADFGSAMQLPQEIRNSRTMILPRGTPLWMAPEVIRGEFQGTESDIWSLGCTVIEMITGKPPWKDLKIGFSNELLEIPFQFPNLCHDFIEKCLRRDPSNRWTCTRLMRHPFLDLSAIDCSKNKSPCSVLGWNSSNFEKDVDETSKSNEIEEVMISARSRIRDLDWRRGPNWEPIGSGWETVRHGWNWGLIADEQEQP